MERRTLMMAENTWSRIIRQSPRQIRLVYGCRTVEWHFFCGDHPPHMTDQKREANQDHQRDDSSVVKVHHPFISPPGKKMEKFSNSDHTAQTANCGRRRQGLLAPVRIEGDNSEKQNRNSQHHGDEQQRRFLSRTEQRDRCIDAKQ